MSEPGSWVRHDGNTGNQPWSSMHTGGRCDQWIEAGCCGKSHFMALSGMARDGRRALTDEMKRSFDMKPKRAFMTLCAIVFLLSACSIGYAATKSTARKKAKENPTPADSLDPKWVERNQKVVALIQDKKPDTALPAAEKLLDYVVKKKLTERQEGATTYNNLGMLYLTKGKFQEAETYLWKAVRTRIELFGKTSPEVATVWLNISQLYKLQAQYILSLNEQEKKEKDNKAKNK